MTRAGFQGAPRHSKQRNKDSSNSFEAAKKHFPKGDNSFESAKRHFPKGDKADKSDKIGKDDKSNKNDKNDKADNNDKNGNSNKDKGDKLSTKIALENEMMEDEKCIQPIDKSKSIPVYWINLEKSKSRRTYFSDQMDRMGYNNTRIEASTKADGAVINATFHVQPRIKETPNELSCVISHLIAVHTAIHDESNKGIPYALICEDDISFELDVDLLTLAENAPKGFGTLQLMTSASNYVNSLWNKYQERVSILGRKSRNNVTFPHDLIWSPRKYDAPYWSAQAYLINKAVVRTFIDKVVTYDKRTSTYSINFINPSETDLPCQGKPKCYLPYRIVSEHYVFHGCQPTYTASIPMFNGASIGQLTTIHMRTNNDVTHAKSFLEIAGVLKKVRKNEDFLPSYIRLKANCTRKSARKLRKSGKNGRKNIKHLLEKI